MAQGSYCNMCGKKFDIWDVMENFAFHRKLGYGTRYDGDTLDLELCCDCMNELIERCKITPIEQSESKKLK